MKELKFCPFCGGKCCVCEYTGGILENYYRWMAHCQDCDCSISNDKNNKDFSTEQAAIKAWNTRHEMPKGEL